jgi:CheY-like chemotaxis protein
MRLRFVGDKEEVTEIEIDRTGYVLVVDDEQSSMPIRILKFFLKKFFPEENILSANSGLEAIEMCKKQDYQGKIALITMDYVMQPEMDGVETMRQIRQIPGYENVCLIGFTSSVHDVIGLGITVRDAMLQAGAQAAFNKASGVKEWNEAFKGQQLLVEIVKEDMVLRRVSVGDGCDSNRFFHAGDLSSAGRSASSSDSAPGSDVP